jgi:4-amino-4-deoxy-L-arabinose transferase-like glycosyltransferase
VLLLLGMGAILAHSAYRRSPVVDEPLHLTRGLAWWWTGDTRLSYAHPPLANLWCALPGALLLEPQDLRAWPGWQEGDVVALAQRLFTVTGEAGRRALLWGRLMTALLALLTAAYLFLRLRQAFGWWTAIVGLALFSAQATLLAHGALVTTDFALAGLGIVLLGEAAILLERRGIGPLLRVGLVAGLAAATKYTALVLPVLVAAVALGYALRTRGRYQGLRVGQGLARCALDLLVVGVLALVTVQATYRFQGTFLTVRETLARPEPRNWITAPHQNALLERTALARAPSGLRLPLPYTYGFGLASIGAHHARGHETVFLGRTQRTGHPGYFPLLLLLKTPLVLWVLLLIGLLAFLRAPAPPSALTLLALLSVAAILALLSASRVNIGFRHALHVIPPLVILGARGLLRALEVRGLRAGRWAALGAAPVAFCVAFFGLVGSYPDLLGHFTEAVGRARGHRISMVGEDWGQDAIDLARFARRARLAPLYYAPYTVLEGAPELERLGVRHHLLSCGDVPPPGAYAAVHVSLLQRRPHCYPWRHQARRVRSIHDHIWVYRLGPAKAPGPGRPPAHRSEAAAAP